jgi:hypothetical protein
VRVVLRAAAVLDEKWCVHDCTWACTRGMCILSCACACACACARRYVPLKEWDSTPATGGLSLKGGRDMTEAAHVDMASLGESDFEALWALIDYTLEFARGARARPEKGTFRKEGRLCWTTAVHGEHQGHDSQGHVGSRAHVPRASEDLMRQRTFIYIRAETDELLYFGMINSLFTLVLEQEPSNHLHTILIPKRYLA